jgi:hypothetical protein
MESEEFMAKLGEFAHTNAEMPLRAGIKIRRYKKASDH